MPWTLLDLTILCGLLIEPLVARGEFSAIHDPGFGNVVPALGLTLLLTISFLGALDGGTRLRRATFGVKSNPVGLVPPDGNAVSIPVLKNVVRLEQTVIPDVPLLVLGIAKDNCLWRLTRFYCRFEESLKPAVVLPG